MEKKIVIASHGESGKEMVKTLKQTYGESLVYLDRLDLEIIRQHVDEGGVILFIGTRLFGDIALAADGEGCINLTYVDAKDDMQLDAVRAIVGMLDDADHSYDIEAIRVVADAVCKIITVVNVKDAQTSLIEEDMGKLLRYFPPIALATTSQAILSFAGNVTAEQVQAAADILAKQLPKTAVIHQVRQFDEDRADTCERSILLFS